MNKRRIIVLGLLFAGLMQLQAQTDTAKTKKTVGNSQAFSLEEAQKFALTNSPAIKNSNIDLEIAKKKIWEMTATGLPQVSAKVGASYMPVLPDLYSEFSGLKSLPAWMYAADQALHNSNPDNQVFGYAKKSDPSPAVSTNDMKWGATTDITASQLLFSGAYIVGLQSTKAFKEISELAITKSTKDLSESVSNAYHLVLVMQENKNIMDSIFLQTQKTEKEMEAMYKSGFIEQTAVDQIKLTVNNLKNTLTVMDNQVKVSKNLLRFQIGLDMSIDIVLTEKLDNLLNQNIQLALLSNDLNINKNIDFQLVQNTTKLNVLQLKFQKATLLPDVAAFYQYDHQFNKNAMTFTPAHVLGASVNIPIFGSGAKISRINQAKLSVEKSKNTEFQVSQSLQLAFSQAKTSYGSAIDKLDANKENLELSKRIYDKTLIKFKSGVSSSMELTQAQAQLLQSETTYYSTVIELVNAKNALDKIIK
jgi:outer membrane protein TolC